MSGKTIISLGNDILGDDGVALRAGDIISEKTGIPHTKTNSFGFEIIEAISGYDEVYIIDAVVVENGKIGELYEYNFNDFNKYLHLSSPHTFNLPTALKMVELYGQLPKIIKIYGINIENKLEFSEEFSEGIKNKIDEITEKIIKNIEELKNSCLEI